MITDMHAAAIITVAALVTIIIRALPFLVFQKSTPEPVLYLGRVLPYAVMGMLVVYCLKDVTPFTGNHGMPLWSFLSPFWTLSNGFQNGTSLDMAP